MNNSLSTLNNHYNLSKPTSNTNNNSRSMSNRQLKRKRPGNVVVPPLLQSLNVGLAVPRLQGRSVPDVWTIDLPV
jgi:hypothetical protein